MQDKVIMSVLARFPRHSQPACGIVTSPAFIRSTFDKITSVENWEPSDVATLLVCFHDFNF